MNEQHLFERVDEFYAKLIGEEILRNITEYEPRIEVLKVIVLPIPDENEYKISILYSILKIKKHLIERTSNTSYNLKYLLKHKSNHLINA